MIKSGIVRKRFYFFVWELLTNEKELLIMIMRQFETLSFKGSHN